MIRRLKEKALKGTSLYKSLKAVVDVWDDLSDERKLEIANQLMEKAKQYTKGWKDGEHGNNDGDPPIEPDSGPGSE